MDRARQIRDLWNWLPAFRAVAETEHLPTAAEAAHVSASALSRAIGLLEDELGVKLFERTGRRIALNEAGKSLLAAVREAMRRVDDGVAEVKSDVPRGPLRIAAAPSLRELVAVPAALALRASFDQLVPVVAMLPDDPQSALLQGRVDIAITHGLEPDDRGVDVADRGHVPYGVFAAAGHPLANQSVDDGAFSEHPFVGSENEPWPASIPRTVALWCDDPTSQIAAVRARALLALLPRALGRKNGLAEVQCAALDIGREVTVLRRRAIGPAPAIDATLDAIEESLEGAGSGDGGSSS